MIAEVGDSLATIEMRIGIFGATGFIGSALANRLREREDEVVGFSRSQSGEGWRSSEGELDLSGLDAVVNLAGESVAIRWTAERKVRLEESRIGLTKRIVVALERLPEGERPRVLLNSSAVGFYGDRGEEVLDEQAEKGEGYLAKLCADWESAGNRTQELGVRLVFLRTGIVIGNGGDAWERMKKVFQLGLGGRLGEGSQWMPWIHLEDQVEAMVHLLDHADAAGAVNLVAPNPVRNAEWTSRLARAAKRPAFFHAPGFMLKAALGGFSSALLGSCRTAPARLLEWGYEFRFPDLASAFADLLKGRE